jgi:hypothetical protein
LPQPGGDADCPVCLYDEVVGTVLLAAGAIGEIEIEPDYTQFFCPQFAHATVVSSADATTNGRAVVLSVDQNACTLVNFRSASFEDGGIVLPDEWQGGSECCLGTPVSWGSFGKKAMNRQLRLLIQNISAFETRVYVTLRGKARDTLGTGWSINSRCG